MDTSVQMGEVQNSQNPWDAASIKDPNFFITEGFAYHLSWSNFDR